MVELKKTCGLVVFLVGSGSFRLVQGLLAGCQGCVWRTINAIPREAVHLYNLVSSGRLVEANEVWKQVLPFQLFVWSTPVYNPAVKAAANLQGFSVGEGRKPQLVLTDSEMERLNSALASLNVSS